MARIPQEINGARVIIRRSRKRRRTVSLGLGADGSVLLRAPLHAPEKFLEDFFASRASWILDKIKIYQSRSNAQATPPASPAFLQHCRAMALVCIEEKAARFGDILGVKPRRIRINSAVSRWGSCSADNNLNFPWRVALLPPEIVDYIVVHELAHIMVKNHGPEFWRTVSGIIPDFKSRRAWLRKNAHLYPLR